MKLSMFAIAATGLALAGCSSTTGPAATDTPAASSEPTAASAPATTSAAPSSTAAEGNATRIEVTVAGGKVTTAKPLVTVPLNSTVDLVVTSDKADELHVHGYNKEAELKPGQPAEVKFEATIPGTFEVETHVSELKLLQLQVR